MNSTDQQTIITIDGPAGAGKGTLAKALARRLNWTYLDTGALYRALAVAAADKGIPADDREKVERLAEEVTLDARPSPEGTRVFIDAQEVTDKIRTPEISQAASTISQWPLVRKALLGAQQKIGAKGQAVVEGRDMGTVVFPGAALKIFLSADLEVRASRRWAEVILVDKNVTLEEVKIKMAARDSADQKRSLSPLKAADEAVIIDNSQLSVEEVLDEVEAQARKVFNF